MQNGEYLNERVSSDEMSLLEVLFDNYFDSKTEDEPNIKVAYKEFCHSLLGHGGKFCVSVFRQNQEYHVINVHAEGLFPLVNSFPAGWNGMRAACGVNAVSSCREYYFKGIRLPCGRQT